MAVDANVLSRLDAAFAGARLWGAELDIQYRVLAATLELTPEGHPYPGIPDRRVQLLLYPVGFIAALLRRPEKGGMTVETFEVDQLLQVVEGFEGAQIEPPIFDPPGPGPAEWGPELSLEGRTNAVDGRSHDFRVKLRAEDGRELRFQVGFDDLRLHTPDGQELPLARFT